MTAGEPCNECTLPVTEDDAAPSCGAHVLHIHCAGWFHCRWCHEIRSEIP